MGSIEKIGAAGIAAWFCVVVAMIIGWVLNAIKLIGLAMGGTFTGNEMEFILRTVGAFFIPLGGVAGWF